MVISMCHGSLVTNSLQNTHSTVCFDWNDILWTLIGDHCLLWLTVS